MKLFILGSFAIDELGHFNGRFQDLIKKDLIEKLSLSFIVENSQISFGGCAGNIAYGLSLLGTRAELCGLLGKDGEDYRRLLTSLGMGMDVLLPVEGQTARAVITSDLDRAQIAHFNPGVLGAQAKDFELPLSAESGDILLVSPENPRRMRQASAQAKAKGLRVFIDLGQVLHTFTSEELIEFLDGSAGVFVNEYEWELLQSLSGEMEGQILRRTPLVVLTKAEKGVELIQADKQLSIPASPAHAVDSTGAGDAFRAGFLSSLLKDPSLEKAARVGAILAAQSVEYAFAQGYVLNSERRALLEQASL